MKTAARRRPRVSADGVHERARDCVVDEAGGAVAAASPPAPRAKVKAPAALGAEFERRLLEGAFGGYGALQEWLFGRGYTIGRVARARRAPVIEGKLQTLRLATMQAREVVEAAGGANDVVNEGLMRLVQGELFRVLIELREIDPKKVNLNMLARNVAMICRSSVQMRRTVEEMRAGIGRRVLAAERKVMAAARRGVRGGLSPAAEKRIRAALLEIAAPPHPQPGDASAAQPSDDSPIKKDRSNTGDRLLKDDRLIKDDRLGPEDASMHEAAPQPPHATVQEGGEQ